MIINILHHPVHCIFEALYVGVVVTDLASGSSDDFLHLVLPISIIIHRKTQTTIDCIASLQRIVHFLRLDFQVIYLGFSWRNIVFKVLNFVL